MTRPHYRRSNKESNVGELGNHSEGICAGDALTGAKTSAERLKSHHKVKNEACNKDLVELLAHIRDKLGICVLGNVDGMIDTFLRHAECLVAQLSHLPLMQQGKVQKVDNEDN